MEKITRLSDKCRIHVLLALNRRCFVLPVGERNYGYSGNVFYNFVPPILIDLKPIDPRCAKSVYSLTRTDTLSADELSHGRVTLLYARPASEQLLGISLVTR